MSRPGSSHSNRSSSHSREASILLDASDNEEDRVLHEDLFERAIAASNNRSRRSQRSSASLHDLEVMQAFESNATLNQLSSDVFSEESEISTQTRRTTNASTLSTGTHTSSAHLRFVLEEEEGGTLQAAPNARNDSVDLDASHASMKDQSEASAYSEYSEYEEDEFDPEWHARQNQQAAMALLAKSGTRGTFAGGTPGAPSTEKTRSVSDMESISEAASDSIGSQLFANHRDLRDEVDQTVNLMDASAGNYDDPREYGELGRGGSFRLNSNHRRGNGKQQPRRDSRTGNFLAAAQHSLVDVFLDTSEGKMPSFRRSMSRNSGGSGSLRLQAQATSGHSHQRRLFYGHSPPPPPTIREGGSCADFFSLENFCKLLIVLFCLVFVVILALPQGMWLIQEKLGIINDKGDPLIPGPPVLPMVPPMPVSDEDARVIALRKMILTHKLSSKEDLLDRNTVQYQATHWLANKDPANLTLVMDDGDGWGIIEPHKILNRYALATFYLAMNGPRLDPETGAILWNETHWHANDDWMSEKHVCEWYGIECEGQSHIEHFNLTHNRLKGTIPSELSILTDLILVDWSINDVSGPFPDFIGQNWLDLEYLFLNKNDLEGALPPSIGNLTHLQELELTHTNLEGSIPTEINQLSQLRMLRADHNNFAGSIPPLGNLTASLEVLGLYSNFLTGVLPPSLFQLTNLVELTLAHNYLKGTIPSQIETLHRLEAFTIGNNEITGLLPDIWGQTPNLVEFEIDNNRIRGTIPPSLARLTNLEYLTLEENPITGTIPSEFGNLESLTVFQAYHNELAGSMPKEVCALSQRRGVDLILFGDCEDGRFVCACCDRCY